MFYAGVVVPTGTVVLGPTTQGFVTREVTAVLNVVVAAAVAALILEIIFPTHDRGKQANLGLKIATSVIGVICIALVFLHSHLDSQLSDDDFAVLNSAKFYGAHRIYLWLSTFQWIASLAVFWILSGDNTRLGNDATSRTNRNH